jgi:hypothetical protein
MAQDGFISLIMFDVSYFEPSINSFPQGIHNLVR